jgi:RNA polymerase sigma-70 factor (ECF subfamily)
MFSALEHPWAAPVSDLPERLDPLAAVARSAAGGDSKAATALLTSVGRPVFAVLEAILGRANPDVDDVAQEAFVAIIDALPAFRFDCTVVHFARRIAVRRASVALRHRRAARRSAAATVPLEDDLPDEDSPLDAAIVARQVSLLREIVGDLPEEQGETLLMRVALGYSVEEIAETTRTPLNTVRSRLRAARAVLRERIDADPKLAELQQEEPGRTHDDVS